jgi:hypothetical protein
MLKLIVTTRTGEQMATVRSVMEMMTRVTLAPED